MDTHKDAGPWEPWWWWTPGCSSRLVCAWSNILVFLYILSLRTVPWSLAPCVGWELFFLHCFNNFSLFLSLSLSLNSFILSLSSSPSRSPSQSGEARVLCGSERSEGLSWSLSSSPLSSSSSLPLSEPSGRPLLCAASVAHGTRHAWQEVKISVGKTCLKR